MAEIVALGNFRPSQLMDELLRQVPTLKRVTDNVADPDMGRVRSNPGTVTVTFADDIDPALVQAVIDAHVPAVPPPPRNYKAELALIPGVPPALVTWLNDVLRLS